MTSDDLFATIDRFLSTPPYYPCLLLVHHEIARLQTVRQQVIDRYGWANLSLGTLLSEMLLGAAPQNRAGLAQRTVADLVRSHRPGPVLCTDIDLLFEPSLPLDPLRLLREASRQASLVVLWPGTFINGVLAYATTAHAHHQTWTRTELCNYCLVAL